MTNWNRAQKRAAATARWAVTMAKVRIRQVLARTRWQLITFCGGAGGESVGVVDMIAIRKDHRDLLPGTKRGDRLQIILIQVKGAEPQCPPKRTGTDCALWLGITAPDRSCWQRGTKGQPLGSSSYDTEAAKVFGTGSRLTT